MPDDGSRWPPDSPPRGLVAGGQRLAQLEKEGAQVFDEEVRGLVEGEVPSTGHVHVPHDVVGLLGHRPRGVGKTGSWKTATAVGTSTRRPGGSVVSSCRLAP